MAEPALHTRVRPHIAASMAQAVAQVVPSDASLRIIVKQLLTEYEALVGRLVKSFLAVAQGTLPAAGQVCLRRILLI